MRCLACNELTEEDEYCTDCAGVIFDISMVEDDINNPLIWDGDPDVWTTYDGYEEAYERGDPMA